MARNRLKPLFRALAAPAYRQYTIGNATSLIGMWVQRLAIGWMAWKLTGSGAWLGVLAMCERCIHPAPDASRGIAYEWRSLRSVSSGSPSVRCSGGGDSSSYSAPGSVDGH